MMASMSVVRPGGGGGEDGEEIRLIIRVSRGKTVTAVISPEDFALAITGKSDVPVELKLRNLVLKEEPYTKGKGNEESICN